MFWEGKEFNLITIVSDVLILVLMDDVLGAMIFVKTMLLK